MANICNDLETKLINGTVRNTQYTVPTTVYVALYTNTQDGTGDSNAESDALTEVTGGSYARQSVAFDAPSNGVTQNTSLITFPTASANWGNINYVIIRDASSGGNAMFWCRTTTSKAVNNGDTYKFNIADIDLSLA